VYLFMTGTPKNKGMKLVVTHKINIVTIGKL